MVTLRKISGDNLQSSGYNLQKIRLQFTTLRLQWKHGRLQFTKKKVTIYNKYGYKCAGKDEKLIMVDRMMV